MGINDYHTMNVKMMRDKSLQREPQAAQRNIRKGDYKDADSTLKGIGK